MANLTMLRFSLGVKRWTAIRNEDIRHKAHVECLETVREARLRWLGHVQRKGTGHTGQTILDMEQPGRWKRERPSGLGKGLL